MKFYGYFLSILLLSSLMHMGTCQFLSHCNTEGTLEDGTEICLECKTGYYLNMTKSLTYCDQCLHHCEVCFSRPDQSYTCEKCKDGYRFDTQDHDKCVNCPGNCKTCDANNKCITCSDGTPVLTSGVCKSQKGMYVWLGIILVVSCFLSCARFCYSRYFGHPEVHTAQDAALNTIDPSMPGVAVGKNIEKRPNLK